MQNSRIFHMIISFMHAFAFGAIIFPPPLEKDGICCTKKNEHTAQKTTSGFAHLETGCLNAHHNPYEIGLFR